MLVLNFLNRMENTFSERYARRKNLHKLQFLSPY